MIKEIFKQLISEKIRNEIRFGLQKLVSPVYYGNRYTCNCCKRSFRKFLAKGNVKRTDAKCPNCGSLERTRLLHLYLKNETNLFREHLKVLHFAPEKCLSDILKKLDIEYIDGDINPALSTHIIDITNIQYPDNYFDLIICSHVLGHVKDEAKAIMEMRRVLKNDGVALVMTLMNLEVQETFESEAVISPKERLINYGESDLYRLHGLDFADRLKEQDFFVKCIEYTKELPQETVSRNCFGDGSRELIFRCTKN